MPKARFDEAALLQEVRGASGAVAALSAHGEAFKLALAAFRGGDADAFNRALDLAGLRDQCRLVCDWFCSKECVLLCLQVAGPATNVDLPDPREFADVVAKVTADDGSLRRLADVVERRDAQGFSALLKELGIERFRHLLCHWVCAVRCRLVCRWICQPGDRRPDLRAELKDAGAAVRALAANADALTAVIRAAQGDDCDRARVVVAGAGLADHCIQICLWLCSWRCVFVCFVLCRRFAGGRLDVGDDEIVAFGGAMARLAGQPAALQRLAGAVARTDEKGFGELVDQLGLSRFCQQLCHWLCSLRCRRFCVCVCPPLVADIDTPAAASCAAPVEVGACVTGGSPLVGIEITGTASGAGFDRYTLQYSWGANPPVQVAVVYPDCSRPPAATSSPTPVVGGTLGYLDVTLLPPGITAFTIYLQVFDTGAGTASDTTTFEIQTKAVEISDVATVDAFVAEDPFHPGVFRKLIKDVVNVSPLVPEQSVGGAFTVTGSAYLIGCDRIMTQFLLVRFDAPPAAPPPEPPTAAGGAQLLPTGAVVYEDIPGHPWQSGCFPIITPNTILNGNLVAFWGTNTCFPAGTVPKVKGTTWNSGPGSGRAVILLEVRDRILPGGPFPGSVAAKDQVVIWIDNQTPVAVITSIGGISGCGDLRLSDFVGTTAEIKGVAYDPPIDPSAPQKRPNDNFGSYALTYKKDGEIASFGIPALTPNTRVPAVWPGPPVGDGTLADWDIVGAIDHTGPPPAPPGKLERGERCAFVITLEVSDTTHVGDSGSNHSSGPFTYAINVINDL